VILETAIRKETMLRILIVEDSLTILQMASEVLAEAGYQVVQAMNGEDAIEIAASQQPDLILLDLILPKMNGYEVCRQIKSSDQTSHIPVIMITSKTKDSDRYWGMEQGADDYITKPFDVQALVEIIHRYGPQVN
jgi:twitching motility two-component system response regulator PilH